MIGRSRQVVVAEGDGDDAGQVEALLSARQAAPEEQVVDLMRVEGGHLVEHGPDDPGGEVIRTHVDERTFGGPSDRGSGGRDDDGFGRGHAPIVPPAPANCQASVVAVTDSRSGDPTGGRRRMIRAQRPRRPTGSPCNSVATTSVPGCMAAWPPRERPAESGAAQAE